ncbi:MAG: Gfo/Idh/MocA family oxidoreductase [Acidimicrobiales bacterium]
MAEPHPGGPIRVAAVGAGWVSQNRHMPALHHDPDVDLAGIVVPEGELAESTRAHLAKQFGPLEFGSSLQAGWLDRVDAVMIGTPPDTHPDLVVAAVEAGKHVLVEKPFALTTAEADRMVDAGAANQRIVSVVHNFQFARAATHARSVIDGGGLGELRAVFGVQSSNHERRLPSWYRELPLGLFTDEAPHLVYLLQALLPEAELESLHVGRPLSDDDNTPDLVSMVLRDGPVIGSLHMTFVGALSEWMVVVLGTRATLVLDLFRDVCFTVPNDHGHLAADVLRTQARAVGGHLLGTFGAGTQRLRGKLDYGNAHVVRRFVAAVRSGVPDPHIDGTRGRDVVRILEAAHRASGSASPA